MKKVLFYNSCIYLPDEGAIKRTFYLFQMLLDQGYDVTFLTSDFNHYSKQKRNIPEFFSKHPEYKDNIKFLPKTPYKKNISIRRYLSNIISAHRAKKWFKEHGAEYDVAYLAVTSTDVVRKIRKYCDKYGVKLIIDVNDLWPDSLKLIIPNEKLYKFLTFFMQKNVNRGYAQADGIVAVSNEYLEKASRVNTRATKRLPVYIGAMLDKFDDGVKKFFDVIEKPSDEFWLSYVGTIGVSYDIETVIRAVDKLNKEKKLNIRFKILGQGPDEKKLKDIANKLKAESTDFLGFMDYEKMAAYLAKSDICMNCLKSSAPQSIINKISDYYAAAKPVLNCGPCKEMLALIDDYQTGINYEAEDVDSLCEAILKLYNDPALCKELGKNSRKLAELKFDRKTTHQEIISLIESI